MTMQIRPQLMARLPYPDHHNVGLHRIVIANADQPHRDQSTVISEHPTAAAAFAEIDRLAAQMVRTTGSHNSMTSSVKVAKRWLRRNPSGAFS